MMTRWMKCRSTAAAVILFMCSQNGAMAWEEDVHFGLTLWLAHHAGFSDDDARQIARANQDLDDQPSTAAVVLMKNSVMSGSESSADIASKKIHHLHFPSNNTPPKLPEDRIVTPNPADVRTRVRQSSSVATIGQALHAFQDTWAHRGVPDIPVRPGRQIRPLFAWAHPRARGGWWRHRADLTSAFPRDAYEMASASYSLLLGKLPKDVQRVRKPKTWDEIKINACQFALLRSRAEKLDWFKQQVPARLTNYAFVSKINLPFLSLPYLQGPRVKDIMDLCDPPQAKIPPDNVMPRFGRAILEKIPHAKESCVGLQPVLESFLKQWIISRRIDSAIDIADIEEIRLQLDEWREGANVEVPDARDWMRRVLLMWLIEDHGTVEALGHGYPYVANYTRLPRSEDEAKAELVTQKERYERLDDAITSDADGPYMIIPVDTGLCVSYFRFKRLYRDMNAVTWSKKQGQWKLSAFHWIAL